MGQVYHAEVTCRLRERRLEGEQDFEWLKVLRFYLEVRAWGDLGCGNRMETRRWNGSKGERRGEGRGGQQGQARFVAGGEAAGMMGACTAPRRREDWDMAGVVVARSAWCCAACIASIRIDTQATCTRNARAHTNARIQMHTLARTHTQAHAP